MRIGFETEHPFINNEWGMSVYFKGADKMKVKLDKRSKLDKENKNILMISKIKYGEDETNIYID
jgi:hypothetical protein